MSREREQRKALLLSQIQQQRLDLSACQRDWLQATRSFDRGWLTLLNLRSWAIAGGGLMAIWGLRRPRLLMRWGKRGLGLWSSWRLIRNTLKRLQR